MGGIWFYANNSECCFGKMRFPLLLLLLLPPLFNLFIGIVLVLQLARNRCRLHQLVIQLLIQLTVC